MFFNLTKGKSASGVGNTGEGNTLQDEAINRWRNAADSPQFLSGATPRKAAAAAPVTQFEDGDFESVRIVSGSGNTQEDNVHGIEAEQLSFAEAAPAQTTRKVVEAEDWRAGSQGESASWESAEDAPSVREISPNPSIASRMAAVVSRVGGENAFRAPQSAAQPVSAQPRVAAQPAARPTAQPTVQPTVQPVMQQRAPQQQAQLAAKPQIATQSIVTQQVANSPRVAAVQQPSAPVNTARNIPTSATTSAPTPQPAPEAVEFANSKVVELRSDSKAIRSSGSDPALNVEEDLKRRFGSNIRSALGPGTVIEGKMSFDSPVRIDGSINGEVTSTSALIVGEQAEVNAKLRVGTIVILGTVTGNIDATELIEIRSGGHLEGDLKTPRIVIEEGGYFEGFCAQAL